MSEQDENQRGGGGGFLLSSPKAPGRLSVLQVSKKENLPLGSTAPALKVSRSEACFGRAGPGGGAAARERGRERERGSLLPWPQVTFQTPLRDPQVRRLLSPRCREPRAGLDSTERPQNSQQALESAEGPEAQARG